MKSFIVSWVFFFDQVGLVLSMWSRLFEMSGVPSIVVWFLFYSSWCIVKFHLSVTFCHQVK